MLRWRPDGHVESTSQTVEGIEGDLLAGNQRQQQQLARQAVAPALAPVAAVAVNSSRPPIEWSCCRQLAENVQRYTQSELAHILSLR